MLFDSDVLIWFLRGDASAARLIDGDAERSLSIVSLMEVIQGAQSKKEMRAILDWFAKTGFKVWPLTETIGHLAAGLVQQYTHAHGIQVAGALIAATAMEHHTPLATANVRHFRAIRGLQVHTFRPQQK